MSSKQCSVVQVELNISDKDVPSKCLDSFYMQRDELMEFADQAMQQLKSRAETASRGREVVRITYQDEDGDHCTLTKETITDALAFAIPLTDSEVCRLQLEVLQGPQREASFDDVKAGEMLKELGTMAQGLDVQLFLQRLAAIALDIAQGLDHPAIFSVIEPLVAIQDGHVGQEGLSRLMPQLLAAARELPERSRDGALAQLRVAAAKVATELREAKLATRKATPAAPGVEVHLNVVCDQCECQPIVGARYKSLEREDYDLCEACYTRSDRAAEQFARVQSETRADVVTILPGPCAADAGSTFAQGESLAEVPGQQIMPLSEAAHALPCDSPESAARILKAAVASMPTELCIEAVKCLSEGSPALQQAVAQLRQEVLGSESLLSGNAPGQAPNGVACAEVLSLGIILGVEAREDEAACGDVTNEFPSLAQELGAQQLYRMGRIEISKSGEPTLVVPACVTLMLQSTGVTPLPEAMFRCVVGDSFGVPELAVGAVQGGTVEVEMDLSIPARADVTEERSAWALVDAKTGAGLGPVVLFDIVWLST